MHEVTYTSLDPLKATIFSIFAKKKGSPILLMADSKVLKNIDLLPSNSLADMEKEIILNIKPSNFAEKSIELTLKQVKKIFKQMDIEVPTSVTDISQVLKQTEDLTEKQIETFVEKAYENTNK